MSRPWPWLGGRPARPILSVMDSDSELLLRLRSGDERAFVSLVERYHEPMLHLAASFVPSRAVAEEVVQDTWLALLRGLEGFEGRSSLKTWLFRILVNRAISAGVRERRSIPVDDMGPVVDASSFVAGGSWRVPPEPWADQVDDKVIAAKIAARILAAIDELPVQQRAVVTLRDVQGLSSGEVCAVLDISDGNLRVLLHRGRSKLRQVIGSEFGRGR
jgi:RNA polymerase sigma-70 factor (ECF subfamily)